MSQESVERFLGRLITDERFREKAKSSLEQSCRTAGYSLSPEETKYLAQIDFKLFSFVSSTLDEAIIRS